MSPLHELIDHYRSEGLSFIPNPYKSKVPAIEWKQNQQVRPDDRQVKGWCRVTKKNPCPVCRKPDWCLIAADGNACICARIQSNKRVGDAGWLHAIDNNYSSSHLSTSMKPQIVQQSPVVSPAELDKVYRGLIAELSLSDKHCKNLFDRGLTTKEIQLLGYRSLPAYGRPTVVHKLTIKGLNLVGIPGFYVNSGETRLSGPVGIVIPVKDIQGHIVGLQIRCDESEGSKYKWVSSANKPHGCSPGAPIHVARLAANNAREIWITEGALKADIANLKLMRTVIAVAGVGNWRGIIPIIRQLRPERVIISYDMDKDQNIAVRNHLDSLTRYLIRSDVHTFEAYWDNRFKGIDDLLMETSQ